MRTHDATQFLIRALITALSACGSAEAGQAGPQGDPLPFATGPEMLPGQNCRSCHGAPSSRYPEAPDWSIAGTIFAGPNSDQGVQGVSVEVVDATGKKVTAVSNAAGNFYTAANVVAPYSVSLTKGSRSITMAVPPPAGGCNACHAKAPVGGAPGRLFLPEDGFDSAAECDEEHTVLVGDTEYDCSPYRCRIEPDECLRACADDADCVAGARCKEGRCTR